MNFTRSCAEDLQLQQRKHLLKNIDVVNHKFSSSFKRISLHCTADVKDDTRDAFKARWFLDSLLYKLCTTDGELFQSTS